MDLNFVTKEYIAAVSTLLVGLGMLISKVWGSGKERMDFQSINRDALRELLRDIQEAFKLSLLENKELRNKWNNDLTSWEQEKKAHDKIEDDLLQRALIAESRIEVLVERLKHLETILKSTDKSV